MIDIERLAREAGLKVGTNISGMRLVGVPLGNSIAHLTKEDLEQFADLVLEDAAKAVDKRINLGEVGPAIIADAIR